MSHASDSPAEAGIGSTGEFHRPGYRRTETHQLTGAAILGAIVCGHGDERFGPIRSLKVGKDGRITDALIDVGGFLGIGPRPVLVPLSQMIVLREIDGSDVIVHMEATKEMLRALPERAP